MRTAKRRIREQKPRLSGVDRLDPHRWLMVASLIDGRLEIIPFACLRGKAGRRRKLRIRLQTRLPTRAQIMAPRSCREKEIRLAMVCTDPLAIEPDTNGYIEDW